MGLTYFRCCIVVALLLDPSGLPPRLFQQAAGDAGDGSKRQKAVELFQQGKRFEALPLLEDLVRANPKDDELLVDLAASLVDHAATVPNLHAAGQERLRARDLLEQAWRLGNASPLAMNLSQFLQQLPASGSIEFSKNPRADQLIRAGEAAFTRRDFNEALKDYSRALEVEPTNYSAALFVANTYDRQDNFAKASEWYERTIRIDRNTETAFRYYADMLAGQGDLERAREMLIQAAVAEPYNRVVWRELHAWAVLSGSQINMVYVSIPPLNDKSVPDPTRNSPISRAWEAYRSARASWQQGGEFVKHFPNEETYRHSLEEEADALNVAARLLVDLRARKDTTTLVTNDIAASELLKLYDAGLIEPYVLFSLGDGGIAQDYSAYRESNRGKLESYMDHFVAPASPHK